ncbi:PREDICTED: VIP36-like protein [Rhagoletis zephyria]|uniref:VIP36-like protein n=1 Tax=Rhagoletis zephyria TaxID=28612 RepID=UPI0008117414|nr:PREDICTED: VIP36-like protein [Rhagoletis zephyria]
MAVNVKISVFCFYFGLSSLLSATSSYEEDLENYLLHSKDHSLVKPFNVPGFWDIFGNVIITPEYVRLTSDLQGRSGGIFNTIPVKANHWEVHLHFKIHGSGSKFFGDGMAFWYLNEPLKPGSVFGASDYFSGFALIIDTYFNSQKNHQKQRHKHPMIALMPNNGSLSYSHDKDGFGVPGILSYCQAEVRQVRHETYLAIRYENEELRVMTNIDGDQEWKHCVSLKRLHLPKMGYFGLSASTGDLSDNHDVIFLKVYELDTESLPENRHSVPMIPNGPSIEKLFLGFHMEMMQKELILQVERLIKLQMNKLGVKEVRETPTCYLVLFKDKLLYKHERFV